MAQTTQIVPQFPFPYVEMHVNDYTLVNDVNTTDDTATPNSIQAYAFISGKGIDNVWIKKTTRSSAEKMYGTSNFRKYGQPFMQALNVLDQPLSHVWMMRVMPDDATYANTLVCVGYKADTEKKEFHVKLMNKTISEPENIKSAEALEKYLENIEVPEDPDEYTVLPLFLFRYTGRGKCGNNYSVRIAPASTYEKEFGIVFYNFQCIDSEKGVTTDANYVAGITSSMKYGSQTATFIDDILSYSDDGIIPIVVKTFDENVDTVFDEYQKFAAENLEDTEDKLLVAGMASDEFNLIYGTKVASEESLPGFVVDTADEETTNVADEWVISDFTSITGVKLESGDDGSLYGEDGKVSEEELINLYKSAFDGTFDRKVLSTNRMNVETFWDANYPLDVKKVLVNLAKARGYERCQLDVGIIKSLSTETVRTLISDYAFLDDAEVSVDIHNYMVKDTATQKKVNVTISYFLSSDYVNFISLYGRGSTYVKARCQLSGHIKNSLLPVIDDYDTELKTLLYNSRFNYFEAFEENVFRRATQNTTQKSITDLLEENNSRLLLQIKKFCSKEADSHIYDFAKAEIRNDFITLMTTRLREKFGASVQTLNLFFDVSQFEAEHSIIHLYLGVTFYGLDKQVICEIDLNKREFVSGLIEE